MKLLPKPRPESGLVLLAVAITAACAAPPVETPVAEPSPKLAKRTAIDDGTYLKRIDPLGGQWLVERIAEADFTPFKAWINFSAGGFLNHGAGCSGGYPAFYQLDGERLTVTRREEVQTGKCSSATPPGRAAAVASERRLAAFLDGAVAWSKPDDLSLILSTPDGTRAVLTRPKEPHPELAGRWLIESIGGQPVVTEQRPATLSIGMGTIGAHADCNGMGSQFTIPAPGQISVTGPIMSSAMGCAPEDAAEDALMAKAMTSAKTYRIEGDRLVFAGGPGMVVRRPPPPDRRFAGQYESCGNTLLGGYHDGPITLAIDETTMRDNANCTASYTADGPNLTLRLQEGPACADTAPPYVPREPITVGGEISTLAVVRPTGFGFDDEGRLILRTGRGLLNMCRKGSRAR